MAQEIEIEYKTLLTKQEYNTLLQALNFPIKGIQQRNYYFETKNFTLKSYHSALRIREKKGHYTLTLKEPHKEGILETHDDLSKTEFMQWTNGQPKATMNVSAQLEHLQVSVQDLYYFGSLTTERREFIDNKITFVLDKSSYNGIVDYELEIEAPSQAAGIKVFHDTLQHYSVQKQEPITKIERFFSSLPQQ